MIRERADVAIVGGGPAGAALATLLARRGWAVTVLERRPAWDWHACGVFAGPAIRRPLAALGIGPEELASLARDVPAMRLETPGGTVVRLTYGAADGGPAALGIDRRRFDGRLAELATAAGATVCTGTRVDRIERGGSGWSVGTEGGGGRETVSARILVGADGIRSLVARRAGVARPPLLHRLGLTFHVAERTAERPGDDVRREPSVDARMVVLDDAYCGLAPVPGGRVNVGVVLRGAGIRSLRRQGARAHAAGVLRDLPPSGAGAVVLGSDLRPLDRPSGAVPLAHRVVRRAGDGWLLIGDAAGFLDPFTGEGLHRALVSAFLAADVIDRRLRRRSASLGDYDRRMSRRFGGKDAVSLLVQAFLARPVPFEYAARRAASRDAVRRTLEAVLADLVPASRGLDPRLLAELLRP